MSQFSFRRFILIFISTIALSFLSIFPQTMAKTNVQSNYEITNQAPFNQTQYYPLKQTVSSPIYQPTGEWVGRLILPTLEEIKHSEITSDWTWIEIHDAPLESKNIVGKKVGLIWNQTPEIQTYLEKVTTDIQFSNWAKKAARAGTVLPERLDGRSHVGPLQSLAGARVNDDMIVSLENVTLITDSIGSPMLRIGSEPTQVTGRYYGLFQILHPISEPNSPRPEACPGDLPCPSDYFRVRPYNPISGQFDQSEMTIRIPQQPPSGSGLFYSTSRQLEASPAGLAGWYIYGAKDGDGIFTAQAIRPRRLFQLKPDQIILGTQAGLDYIQTENWQNTEQRKGTAQSILVDPNSTNAEEAIADWKEGDFALVIHLFGGTGGEKGDKIIANTVTGHFAYGLAQVVRDPITKELQFEILYQQIYSQSGNAIISGKHSWANYMGNLQRGWLGTRPISDVLIKWEPFTTDYIIENQVSSPLRTLMNHLHIMTARYRSGDGTGVSSVTPATSCVQDSTQGLYMAMASIQRQFDSNPGAKPWLQQHLDHPQVIRFLEFVTLAQKLESFLTPLGVIRPDWQINAEYLAGVNNREGFISEQRLRNIALSSQSVMPRKAHDEVSRIFLEQGAKLWFLRTNQVGGFDPDTVPIAPTLVFGR